MTVFTFDDLAGATLDGDSPVPKLSRRAKTFLDTPSKVVLTYIDEQLNHSQNVVFAQVQAEQEKVVSVNLPVVMTQSEAKTLVDRTLYLQRLSRISYSFKMPRQYLIYDPGDVIAVDIQGELMQLMITDIDYDPRGLLTFTAVENDEVIYSSQSNYTNTTERTPIQIVVPGTALATINIPYVSDDDNGSTISVVARQQENWRGAALYASFDDGATYSLATGINIGTFFGTTASTLGVASPALIDRGNTLTITPDAVVSISLESVSEISMLNGSNSLLVGNEIIRFRDADLQPDGSIMISTLQRGIRGTENDIVNHATGEAVYLLDYKTNFNPEINRAFKLKAISNGSSETINSVSSITVTPLGRGLRPYAPCHAQGNRASNGDIAIAWERRTRLGGEWRGAGEVPLSEDIEQYQIDVMNGANIARTITVDNQKSVNYTAAQQVIDFGGTQASITFNFYQISSAYGRGSKLTVTL